MKKRKNLLNDIKNDRIVQVFAFLLQELCTFLEYTKTITNGKHKLKIINYGGQ